MEGIEPNDILTDLVRPGLKLIICGSAVGTTSAARSAYYAGRGNRFWTIMREIGLTGSEPIAPEDWRRLGDFDIGLTDLAKRHFGMDRHLPPGCYDNQRLRDAVTCSQPVLLAFNGKTAARHFLGLAVDFGVQEEAIGGTEIWVLPSTSGAANGFWRSEIWHQMAERIEHLLSCNTQQPPR